MEKIFFQEMDNKRKLFFEEKLLNTRRIIALEIVVYNCSRTLKDIVTINFDNSGIVLMIKGKRHISLSSELPRIFTASSLITWK